MRWARKLRIRLRSLVERRRVEEELDEELRFHLEGLTEEHVAAGMAPADARYAALREMGGLEQRKEECRDARGLILLDQALQDCRHGVRQLRRDPAFACTSILVLAMSIAATTAIFSITHAVLWRDLPYAEPDRLLTLASSSTRLRLQRAHAGAADYFDWRRRQQVFEDLALTRPVASYNLTGAGEPERLQGARITASLFSTLRVTPLLGRTFTEREQLDPARAGAVAVLSHALWQRRFGADPAIVGRRILLNGRPHEVLGVMRPEFQYPARGFELWTPLYIPAAALAARLDYSYLCVARLKPGVSLDQARAHMGVLASDLAREYPQTNKDDGVFVGPMLGEMTVPVRLGLFVLLAAVGILFLVGCINMASLLLARNASRSLELSIRASLGATRSRLARQFVAEAVPLAVAGALLGIAGARGLLLWLVPLLPASMPRVEEIALSAPVLLVAVTLSAAATLVVALAPALSARASIGRGPGPRARVRDLLLVGEIACAVLLLVSGGLLSRSFAELRATDPGFRAAGVLSLHVAVSRTRYGDDPGIARYLGRLIERVRAVPGVASVGIVNRLPLGGQTQIGSIRLEHGEALLSTDWRSASPEYFRALEVPLLTGRTFTESDVASAPAVGIVDERLASEAFGGESPIGKRFRIDAPGAPWVEIVGVVGHLRHEGLDKDPRPQVYWPYTQRTQDRMAMVVRASVDPSSLATPVRAAIHEVDPDQPVYDVQPMTGVLERSLQGRWLDTVLVGGFGGMALLLASVGLYGVVSQLTLQRHREFGVRVAVGATAMDVAVLVVKQGLKRAASGLVAGLALSAVLTRVLRAMLHGVSPLDAMTYACVTGLLTIVVVTACFVPAWRAARADPTRALRQE